MIRNVFAIVIDYSMFHYKVIALTQQHITTGLSVFSVRSETISMGKKEGSNILRK